MTERTAVDDLQTETGRGARRVVVGIDGSPESGAALRWALRYLDVTGGEVHAVAVWQQPIQFGAGAGRPPPAQEFEAEARSWLVETLPDPDGDRARVHTSIEEGQPAAILLDHALRADLLVLGNHGRGAIRGALLGSVALRCVTHAPCPVLLVPTPSTTDATPAR